MIELHLSESEWHWDVYFKDSSNMSEIDNETITLTITSPPYFNLKDYSKLNKQQGQLPDSPKEYYQTYQEYLAMLKAVFTECFRVTKFNGMMVVNADIIKIKTEDKNIIPIPFDIINICKDIGFGCKDILIYQKLTGVPFEIANKLPNRHEYLLWFAKSNDYLFNLDDIKTPYPEDYPYPPGHERRNDIGMNPTTIWPFYPPFQSGGDNHYHYCPFPFGLCDRSIKLFTNQGDWVLDPFAGSGQVLARAKFLKRNAVGYEIKTNLKKVINQKIQETKIGTDEEIKKIVDYTIIKNEPKEQSIITNKIDRKLKPFF